MIIRGRSVLSKERGTGNEQAFISSSPTARRHEIAGRRASAVDRQRTEEGEKEGKKESKYGGREANGSGILRAKGEEAMLVTTRSREGVMVPPHNRYREDELLGKAQHIYAQYPGQGFEAR